MLASIGQLEFFYDQAPDVMRSCSMALQLLSVAAGSYLSGQSCSCCAYCLFYMLPSPHHVESYMHLATTSQPFGMVNMSEKHILSVATLLCLLSTAQIVAHVNAIELVHPLAAL